MKALARASAVVLVGVLTLSGSIFPPGQRLGLPVALAQTGPSTTRVSISSAGQEGNGASQQASVSGDGRYIAFQSISSNLVSGDSNKVDDIFVRDTTAQTTTRISLTSSAKQGNGSSSSPDIASGGRYVAFQSDASNLVSGDRNAASDVFLRDLSTNTTTRVSLTSSGSEGNGASQYPSISADGRYVAFLSSAANLVIGDSNGMADVFVRDRTSGTTSRVSISSSGAQANGASSAPPAVSADGRYVAFASSASNLVQGDGNGIIDIFVRDRTTGTTTRVSQSSFAEEANSGSTNPAISSDGRYVAFESGASNLALNDLNHWADVFVHEVSSGQTTRVSVTSTGADANSLSGDPAISSDGRYVAFRSAADNLATSDTNVAADVFLHDVTTGATERISVSSSGSGGSQSSLAPDVSSDGRFVAFQSDAGNLVTGDTNSVTDIFLRDRGPQPGPPAVVVDEPAKDDRVFGVQVIAATVDQSFSATSVAFLVDGAVVGSDVTAPYSIQWDTTTVPDGDHQVTAKAVASGGASSESLAVSVSVINTAACDERLHADFDAGKIGVDEYVRSGMHCVYEPRLLSARHSSTTVPVNTEEAYSRFIAHWNDVSQATRDEMTTLFQYVNSGFYATQLGTGGTASQRTDAGPSVASSSVECHYGIGYLSLPTGWCEYTTTDNRFHITWAPEGFTNEIPWIDQNPVNGVPDRIDTIENSLREALAKYTGPEDPTDTDCDDSPLGFRTPEFPIDVTMWRADFQLRGDGFAPPPVVDNTEIYMDSDTDGIYLPRHELFHVIQWRYASFADWRDRQGTSMWMEATAEWAAHQSLPSDSRYANALPEFLGVPEVELEHGSIFDSDGREYGAFILAEYLEERFGWRFIRQSWDRVAVDDELGALEAIDDLLRTQQGLPGGLRDILPDFWSRNYRLEAGSAGYIDSGLAQWKAILALDPRTWGDATESQARPNRTRVVLSGGRFATEVTGVERGGASFVDLVHDFGRPMTLRLKVANFTLLESLTSDDIRLTLLSFDDYPYLCPSASMGEPLARQPINLTISNGVALPPPIQLDASCRFSTLVVTNSDAVAGQTILQLVAAKVDGAPAPGDVFVSDENGFVQIYRPDGTRISTWDTGKSGVITGSTFDAAGNFYATAFHGRTVRKFAPDGTLLGDWGSGYLGYPESILFDASGNGYVGSAGPYYPYNSGGIQKRASDGALIKTFSVELQRRGADWIALRPDGCTMLYTSEGTRILQYDVCSDQQLADFNTDTFGTKYAIQLRSNGGVVVAADYRILRYDAQGALLQIYDGVAPLNEWFALALDPDGTSFWAGDVRTGEVARFDITTGNKLISFNLPAGSGNVGGISIRPNIGGAMTQQAMRTTQWGFDVPSPGQPYRTEPIEDEEEE